MTEEEWSGGGNLSQVLAFVKPESSASKPVFATDRQLRLISVGCCRIVWERYVDDRSRNAIEVLERFADGLASEAEVEEARQGAMSARPGGARP
jgi:hypothetical protein